MTLYELKQGLANKVVPRELIIFVPGKAKSGNENKYADKDVLKLEAETKLNNFHFLANAYVDALCEAKSCNKIEIESIFEPLVSSLSLVVDYENSLCVYKTETFDTKAETYTEFLNTVVICEKIEKDDDDEQFVGYVFESKAKENSFLIHKKQGVSFSDGKNYHLECVGNYICQWEILE